jgi:hypothetical protein
VEKWNCVPTTPQLQEQLGGSIPLSLSLEKRKKQKPAELSAHCTVNSARASSSLSLYMLLLAYYYLTNLPCTTGKKVKKWRPKNQEM